MDFDEYAYLEKAVDEDAMDSINIDKNKDEKVRETSRSDRKYDRERNGRDRDRNREAEKDMNVRDRDRSRRGRGRDGEKESNGRDRDGDRERRNERDRAREKEKDGERVRDKDREKEREKEREREMERERSREKPSREKELERGIPARERRFKDKKEREAEVDPDRDQRTVFAYQMPLKATERDVYEFFSKAGKARDVRLITDRNSRRSKGVGYIEFYDAMSVPMAIAMSGQLLLGQPVMVKPSEAEKNLVQSTATGGSSLAAVEAARKIYIGNLHFNITEDQLRQLQHSIITRHVFEPFGPVELVQLPLDLETGQCKGYGFVQFVQIEHAKAAQSLNGKLEIAGRVIKVSLVTDHITMQETGANTVDFDDDDGGGLSLNARSRAMLMQKLDRTGTASSIAGTIGVPMSSGVTQPIQHALPTPMNVQGTLPFTPPTLTSAVPIGDPSECLILTNMFDPSTEMDPEFDMEIKDDVQDECSKFGTVKHIHVDKHSSGHVYLQFDTVTAASSCQRAMHMRWFAGRAVSATFLLSQDYDAKFASKS